MRSSGAMLAEVALRKKKALRKKQNMSETVDRLTIAPSQRIHLEAANNRANSLLRPMIPADIPFLYRVFNHTVQRVPLHYTSLCSWAAFILIIDAEREAVGWFGEECKMTDRQMTSELGLKVLHLDLRKPDATYFPFTSESNDNLRILRYMLPKLWCEESVYKSKKSVEDRKKMCFNSPVSIGVLDKFIDGSYALREVAYAAVDETTGSVPRLRFVDIEKNTIAVVNHSDQWDIWVARGCTSAEEEFARSYVSRLASTRATSAGSAAATTAASALDSLKKGNLNIRIIKQGCERVLFCCHMKALTDYEPVDKTIPWRQPGAAYEDDEDEGSGGIVSGLTQKVLIDPFGSTVGAMAGAAQGLGNAVGGAMIENVFGGLGGAKGDVGPSSGGVRQGLGSLDQPESQKQTGDRVSDPGTEKERIDAENAKAGAGAGAGAGAKAEDKSLGGNFFFGSRGDKFSKENGSTVAWLAGSGSQFAGAPLRKGHPYEGRDMLTHDMMDFNDDLSMGVTKSNQVIEAATYEPFILIGYQIEIDEGLYRGRHVVTATRKTALFHKSQFRLSNLETEDTWIKLKRGHKVGVPFRVLRRVFDPM